MILPNLSGIESASGEDSSGIDPASGRDSSRIKPASGKDESGEDETGKESNSGAGNFWKVLTNFIWLFSEVLAVSLFRSGFSSNQHTQKVLEKPNF